MGFGGVPEPAPVMIADLPSTEKGAAASVIVWDVELCG